MGRRTGDEAIIRAVRAPSQRRRARPWVLAAIGAALVGVGLMIARDAIPAAQGPAPMVALGAQVLDAELVGEGVTAFRLNGVPVSGASGSSDAGLDAVLGEARSRCVTEAAIDPRALIEGLRAPRGEGSDAPLVLGSMVVEEDQGFVVCLDRFAEPPARGAMRYVYARRVPGGGTRFVVVWTDAPVALADLARTDHGGEVSGEDVEGLPRPEGARRRASFARADGRVQLVTYEVSQPVEALERWARDALPAAGWTDLRASGAAGARVLRARRGSQSVHLVARADRTLVVLARR